MNLFHTTIQEKLQIDKYLSLVGFELVSKDILTLRSVVRYDWGSCRYEKIVL